jgi:hypothetical protein
MILSDTPGQFHQIRWRKELTNAFPAFGGQQLGMHPNQHVFERAALAHQVHIGIDGMSQRLDRRAVFLQRGEAERPAVKACAQLVDRHHVARVDETHQGVLDEQLHGLACVPGTVRPRGNSTDRLDQLAGLTWGHFLMRHGGSP